MKKLVIFFLLFLGIEVFALGSSTPNSNSNLSNSSSNIPQLSQKELAEELSIVASTMNKKLPLMVDSVTRLDKVSTNKNIITYQYTIINMTKSSLGNKFSMFEDVVKRGITANVCKKPSIVTLLKMGAVLEYLYFGGDSIFLTKFRVSKNSCH